MGRIKCPWPLTKKGGGNVRRKQEKICNKIVINSVQKRWTNILKKEVRLMQLINQRPNLLGWRLCGVTNGMG